MCVVIFIFLFLVGAGIEPAPGGWLGETGANHFRGPWPHRAGVAVKFDEPLQACFVFFAHGSDPALTLAGKNGASVFEFCLNGFFANFKGAVVFCSCCHFFDFFFVFVVGVVPSIWDDYLTRLIFCKQLFSRK